MATLFATAPALAEPPPGQSALLNGMHDIESWGYMKDATDGCDKGWITDLRYIGTSGQPNADCHDAQIAAGISIIQRLDADGSQSFPLNPALAPGYADAFASYASQCSNIHVWIVGNEPNFTASNSDPATYASPYAEAYAKVHQKLHAVPGHESDLVLAAPASPYSPYCICSMHKIIQEIKKRGVSPDGFAVHAYTQAQFPGEYGGLAGLVTSEQMSQSNDFCGYPFHWQFRIYRDWIDAIEAEGDGGKPVFITESGNACAPQSGNPCYPDSDVGYFHAMLKEINDYNKDAGNPTKIRAITPYRWTLNDDGTGRDFAIGDRPALLGELKGAFGMKYTWTSPKSCGGMTSCSTDADCQGSAICDLGSLMCSPTQACGPEGACPAGEVCREGTFDCVPASRGPASIVFDPASPSPGGGVTIDVSADIGYTNIGLELTLVGGAPVSTMLKEITGSGPFHWVYTATLAGSGTYRAVFKADPGASTVYGVGYVNVGDIDFPSGSSSSSAGAGGGGAGSVNGSSGSGGPGSGGGGASSGGGESGCDCDLAAGAPSSSARVSFIAGISISLLALRRRRRAVGRRAH
jgi:hypothetical protein